MNYLYVVVFLLFNTILHSQNVEIIGGLKLMITDTVTEGQTVLVRNNDGTISERSNLLRVSPEGDTLFLGNSFVIVPGISDSNPIQIPDIDGNTYSTVEIGSQTWLGQNLKTTKYNDGTSIPLETNNIWGSLTNPAYCWYDNNEGLYKIPYGALYNWYVVDTISNGNKNVCPVGWHVPSEAEVEVLKNYLSPDPGGQLKEIGLAHWISPNQGATNSSGFTAVPAGVRLAFSGLFNALGYENDIWVTNPEGPTNYNVISYATQYNVTSFLKVLRNRSMGASIRCIKN